MVKSSKQAVLDFGSSGSRMVAQCAAYCALGLDRDVVARKWDKRIEKRRGRR